MYQKEHLSVYETALVQIYKYLKGEINDADLKKQSQVELQNISKPKIVLPVINSKPSEVAVKSNPVPKKPDVSIYDGCLPEPPMKCNCVVLSSDEHIEHLRIAEEWEARFPKPKNPSRCYYVYPMSEDDDDDIAIRKRRRPSGPEFGLPYLPMECDCYVLSSKTHIEHMRARESEHHTRSKRRSAIERSEIKKKAKAKQDKQTMKKWLSGQS